MTPRIALYSHDAQGLGHVRRNLAIAEAVAAGGDRDVLLVSGAKEAGVFTTPPGVELLILPGLDKVRGGPGYRPRSLALPLDALIRLRAQTMCAALEAFAPDVLVVDKHPLGIEGELRPTLDVLGARGQTRIVLGLREVLDDPVTVHREWRGCGALEAVRSFYDAVWVYGDPKVYDPVREYALGDDIADLVRHTGYLGRPAGLGSGTPELPEGEVAACLVGGGEDGFALAAAFAAAPQPDGMTGVVVAGPFMPAAERKDLHAVADARDDLVVLDFLDGPGALIGRATCAVTMGGYNSICELLHQGCRTLVVPRVHPRVEQRIRAQRLAAHGVVDVLQPADATAEAIGGWLADRPGPREHPRDVVDLDGLARLPDLVDELLTAGGLLREAPVAV